MFPARYVLHTLARLRVGQSRFIVLVALATIGVVVAPSVTHAAQLNLSWSDMSGGQASFSIERATGTAGTYTQIAQNPPGSTSHTDTTVSAGTAYCYRVQAFNNGGASPYSNVACGTSPGGFTVMVVDGGTGRGTVASSSAGINCGTMCSKSYPSGTVVTLTATATSGSIFSGWSGGGCSGTAPCTLTGNMPVTVTATFVATTSSDTTPPSTPTTLVPSVVSASQVNLSWSPSTDNVGVTGYRVERCQGGGCSAFVQVATPTGAALSDTGLSPSTSYSYRVRATDGAGNLSKYSSVASVTTSRSSTTTSGSNTTSCPCTIWKSSSSPAVLADPDTQAVELGVKFRADVDGFITGIRFYKSAANTGTHVGHLWTSTGQQLASVTFTGETPSGWQQATFSTPVAVSANTVYIASYHTNGGRYSADGKYFATKSVDTPPLHALSNGIDGGNGVYRYGASGFPNQTYNSSNYWVDVVFTVR